MTHIEALQRVTQVAEDARKALEEADREGDLGSLENSWFRRLMGKADNALDKLAAETARLTDRVRP